LYLTFHGFAQGTAVFTFRTTPVDSSGASPLLCFKKVVLAVSRWSSTTTVRLRIKALEPGADLSALASDVDSALGWTDVPSLTFKHNAQSHTVAAEGGAVCCSAFQLVVAVDSYNVGLHQLQLVAADPLRVAVRPKGFEGLLAPLFLPQDALAGCGGGGGAGVGAGGGDGPSGAGSIERDQPVNDQGAPLLASRTAERRFYCGRNLGTDVIPGIARLAGLMFAPLLK
jgi:hypothetical protein